MFGADTNPHVSRVNTSTGSTIAAGGPASAPLFVSTPDVFANAARVGAPIRTSPLSTIDQFFRTVGTGISAISPLLRVRDDPLTVPSALPSERVSLFGNDLFGDDSGLPIQMGQALILAGLVIGGIVIIKLFK